ncbi:hypothetical protein TKK_0003262 [Trichogramma kaykai]
MSNKVTSTSDKAIVSQSCNFVQEFQRFEIDNALLYAYQVKAKLRDNPKLYEDFLIMMKYYESGEIDQLGVFRRIGHIFQEHPELIVGFNQVLTPGFSIQVQTNDQGCAVRVSLCMSISPPTIMPSK